MKLLDTSPFIRYAIQHKITPEKSLCTSRDCRLFYIINGKGDIVINNKKYPISDHTVFLWQSYTEYQFFCDEPIEMVVINFDYTHNRSNQIKPFSVIKLNDSKSFVFNDCKKISFECEILNEPVFCYDTRILKPLQTIISERYSNQPLADEKTSAILKTVIIDIVRSATSPFQSSSTTNKLEKVMKYIHANYMNEISNEMLAEIINYHPNYLNRIFKKINGLTIHQYIIKYRITVAENLLITTDYPITAIAENVGFPCMLSFTSNFKKINSILPTEYRKRYNG